MNYLSAIRESLLFSSQKLSKSKFLPLYKEIAEFRKSPEEVIGMYSETLAIMDRNMERLMVDELREKNGGGCFATASFQNEPAPVPYCVTVRWNAV